MEQVISILETVLPVFLALGLGMLCRKTGFLSREAVDAFYLDICYTILQM